MKNIKALILSLLFLTGVTFSQPKLDSISIYYPTKDLKLETIKKIDKLNHKLDSLNKVFKTDEFILHYYRSDGIIMRCRVKPIKEKPKKLLAI